MAANYAGSQGENHGRILYQMLSNFPEIGSAFITVMLCYAMATKIGDFDSSAYVVTGTAVV